MSGVLAHNPVVFTGRGNVFLNARSDVANVVTGLDFCHAGQHRFTRHSYQSSRLLAAGRFAADKIHSACIAVILIFDAGDIHIDDVALLQDHIGARNAVADHVIDGSAERFRIALVVQGCGSDASLQHHIMSEAIDFLSADAGSDNALHGVKNIAGNATRFAHCLDFSRCFYIDFCHYPTIDCEPGYVNPEHILLVCWPMSVFLSPFSEPVSFAVADPAVDYVLHPLEESALSPQASPKRRREFRLGRAAANKALRSLLGDAPPVLKEEHREPLWPGGVRGSITHSNNWGLAAVVPAHKYLGLGLDLEFLSARQQEGSQRAELVKRICHAEEAAWVDEHPEQRELRATMLFSAKESVFKAFFPLIRKYIGFKDVVLSWDESRSAFQCRLLFDAGPRYRAGSSCEIKCRSGDGHVLSALLLDQEEA